MHASNQGAETMTKRQAIHKAQSMLCAEYSKHLMDEIRRQRRLAITFPVECVECGNDFLSNLETLASSCEDCTEARNINRAH